MAWTIALKKSVLEDLRWFGKKNGRMILNEAEQRLAAHPLVESANMKTLRPNPVAQRELRLSGNYRVLFNVDQGAETVTIVLVGEKRGNSLFVRGEEFTRHHEGSSTE
jgi:mRNA-degrading endonuclease RelE of RelBE toxin-antitoxin system